MSNTDSRMVSYARRERSLSEVPTEPNSPSSTLRPRRPPRAHRLKREYAQSNILRPAKFLVQRTGTSDRINLHTIRDLTHKQEALEEKLERMKTRNRQLRDKNDLAVAQNESLRDEKQLLEKENKMMMKTIDDLFKMISAGRANIGMKRAQ